MKRRTMVAGVLALTMAASAPALAGDYSVLWSFSGSADGGNPLGRVTVDAEGGLIGTTVNGGANYYGAVYRLSRPTTAGGPWHIATLHNFSGTDGANPYGDILIAGSKRQMFGTTMHGGAANVGTVFKLTPVPFAPIQFSVLHEFTGGADGGNPRSGVSLCGGMLCGATTTGGITPAGSEGFGTVYRVGAQAPAGGTAPFYTLYQFPAGPNGSAPYATPVPDGTGALVGTDTGYAGGDGGVYRLEPASADLTVTPWKQTVLHTFFFTPGDGYEPLGQALRARNGTIYGTTLTGGTAGGGVVYRLSPPAPGAPEWTETVMANLPAGCTPQGRLVPDGFGGALGTAGGCGAFSKGMVFRLSPKPGGKSWTLTDIHDFAGGSDGEAPVAGLTVGGGGVFYGTTAGGGATSNGTIFALTL